MSIQASALTAFLGGGYISHWEKVECSRFMGPRGLARVLGAGPGRAHGFLRGFDVYDVTSPLWAPASPSATCREWRRERESTSSASASPVARHSTAGSFSTPLSQISQGQSLSGTLILPSTQTDLCGTLLRPASQPE